MSVDESSQYPTDYNEYDDDDDDDEDGNEDLSGRDDTSMQLFHFSFSVLHSLFVILRTTKMPFWILWKRHGKYEEGGDKNSKRQKRTNVNKT